MYEKPQPGTRVHVEFDGEVLESSASQASFMRVKADEKFGSCYHDVCFYSDEAFKVIEPDKPVPAEGEVWLCERDGEEMALLRVHKKGYVRPGLAMYEWVNAHGWGVPDGGTLPIRRIFPEVTA